MRKGIGLRGCFIKLVLALWEVDLRDVFRWTSVVCVMIVYVCVSQLQYVDWCDYTNKKIYVIYRLPYNFYTVDGQPFNQNCVVD